MRSKIRWASAMALVGTLFSVVLSVHGSGAAAEVMIPRLVAPAPSTQFVSLPIVQQLPGADNQSGAGTLAQEGSDEPQSLAALVAEQPAVGQLSAELRCLAGAIYFEARGESQEGQLAVGRVIVNRASSGRFPDSYCGVVLQPSQFSFVRGRRMPSIPTASRAWREAVAIARIADQGAWSGPAQGALYFHAARVAPGWKRLTKLTQVDNHVFYR